MVGSDSGTPPIACNPALRSSLCGPFLVYIKPSLSTACIGIPPASEPREPRDHRTDGHTENQPAGPGCGQNFTDCVEQVVDECQVTEVHETLLSENRLRAGGRRNRVFGPSARILAFHSIFFLRGELFRQGP